jgi:hypothetical protein
LLTLYEEQDGRFWENQCTIARATDGASHLPLCLGLPGVEIGSEDSAGPIG